MREITETGTRISWDKLIYPILAGIILAILGVAGATYSYAQNSVQRDKYYEDQRQLQKELSDIRIQITSVEGKMNLLLQKSGISYEGTQSTTR